jgi:hypothetical protein
MSGNEPKRKRKLNFPKMIERIEKETGKTVTSVTDADGNTYRFGEETAPATTNPWDSIYDSNPKRPS